MVDMQRLGAALDYAEDHPDEHDQDTWAMRTPCGTACCIAGRVVLQAGAKLIWNQNADSEATDFVVANSCRTAAGTIRNIAAYAIELLGVTHSQARSLFSATNTIESLRVLEKELANDPLIDLGLIGWDLWRAEQRARYGY